MTKADIVKEVSRQTGIEATAVAAIVDGVMGTVKGSVTKGEPVYLRGFGTFFIRHRAAKAGRDINANTTVQIEAKDVPAFKPCKSFKGSMNPSED